LSGYYKFWLESNEADNFQIIDAAVEAGINFFDMANVYGFSEKLGEGLTEQIIGKWLAPGNSREKIVLATKVYIPMGTGPNDFGLLAFHIRQSVENSLRRLKPDHIDVLLNASHRPGGNTAQYDCVV
jgi:aryl-alcohol dehydrogenase-like predicted oxidoreductase